jgi:two-component system alkaline phosphatase synthesis response regulator PhoP
MSKTILVVDDEKQIVKVVKGYLEQAGFRVVTAHDGQMALTVFRHERPDLVVLDLNLPEIDGLDVCRTIRKESQTPVIMLTARAEETDKLIGLEIGADDYVAKPFSPREVVARVRVVLRRVSGEVAPPNVLRAADLLLDLERHTLQRGEQTVELTPTEFTLLVVLMQNAGRALTRTQLLDKALGDAFEGYERTIDAHIKNLRRKVERNPQAPRHIVTVFGVGYKFVE